MKTMEMHGTFEETIAQVGAPVQALARALRALIEDVHPDVVEVPWPQQAICGYGVGPKKMSEQYCYIAMQRGYANLGFYYGAHLPDPGGLLEGSGKSLRHVKVRSVEEAGRPALRSLLMAALEERKKALGRG